MFLLIEFQMNYTSSHIRVSFLISLVLNPPRCYKSCFFFLKLYNVLITNVKKKLWDLYHVAVPFYASIFLVFFCRNLCYSHSSLSSIVKHRVQHGISDYSLFVKLRSNVIDIWSFLTKKAERSHPSTIRNPDQLL